MELYWSLRKNIRVKNSLGRGRWAVREEMLCALCVSANYGASIER